MRLTLRTLLAYLDDTLEPSQARDIGKQIAGSDYAKGIVAKCKEVMRRRRLAAPDPDPDKSDVDANIVAEYLDSVLKDDIVGKAEKKFIADEQTLAEVVCVHQILSLVLGKPADVKNETRRRMYDLIGKKPDVATHRRTVAAVGEDLFVRPDPQKEAAETQPIPLTLPPYLGKGRSGQAAALAVMIGLIGLLTVVLYKAVSTDAPAPSTARLAKQSLPVESPDQGTDSPSTKDANAVVGAEPSSTKTKKTSKAEAPTAPEKPEPKDQEDKVPSEEKSAAPSAPSPEEPADKDVPEEKPKPSPSTAKSATPNEQPDDAKKPAKKVAATGDEKSKKAADAVDKSTPLATYQYDGDVLLSRSASGFSRLKKDAFVFPDDQIVSLEGFRPRLQLSRKASLQLIGMTRVHLETPADGALALRLQDGRFVLRSGGEEVALTVLAARATVRIKVQGANAMIALERKVNPPYNASAPLLVCSVLRGVADVSSLGEDRRVEGLHRVSVGSGGKPGAPEPFDATPAWIAEPNDFAMMRAAAGLARLLPWGEGLQLDILLREEMKARTREARHLAIRGLLAMDSYAALVEGLSDPDHDDVRLGVIRSLRERLWSHPEEFEFLGNSLIQYEPADAQAIAEMLNGYNPSMVGYKDYEKLVLRLSSDLLALRELAVYNLEQLTGTNMGYSASATAVRRNTPLSKWNRWLQEQAPNTLP